MQIVHAKEWWLKIRHCLTHLAFNAKNVNWSFFKICNFLGDELRTQLILGMTQLNYLECVFYGN